jgi:hypothetical protein
MIETLMNAVQSSDVVAVATVRRTRIATVEQVEFLRTEAEIRELLKSTVPDWKLLVDIRTAGLETPQMEVDTTYVFFVRAPAGVDPHRADRWLVANLPRPVRVPATQPEAFLQCLRESVRVYSSNPAEQDLKRHLLRMLHLGVPYFQSDATRLAPSISSWSPTEVDQLVAFLGDKAGAALEGDERINLSAVIVNFGDSHQVVSFARGEFLRGNTDGLYYGLLRRKIGSVDQILWALLDDPDAKIKIGALRVAGLLRRGDIIDKFEKQYGKAADTHVSGAIVSARALVTRDF